MAPVGILNGRATKCPGAAMTAKRTNRNTKTRKSGIVSRPGLKLSTSIASSAPKNKKTAAKQIQTGRELQTKSNATSTLPRYSDKNQAIPRRTNPARTSPKPGTKKLSKTPNHRLLFGGACVGNGGGTSISAPI